MNLSQIRSAVNKALESADAARPEDVSVEKYDQTNTVYLETDFDVSLSETSSAADSGESATMYIPPHVLSAVAELGYEPRDINVMANGNVRVPLTEHYRFKYE